MNAFGKQLIRVFFLKAAFNKTFEWYCIKLLKLLKIIFFIIIQNPIITFRNYFCIDQFNNFQITYLT